VQPMTPNPDRAPSPPVASPPPRTTAPAPVPPVQATKVETPKAAKVDPLAGLTAEALGGAGRAYGMGVDVDAIMKTYGMTVEQLDALTKKYPGLPRQRDVALQKLPRPLAAIPTQASPLEARAAAVPAPNPTPPRAPKPAVDPDTIDHSAELSPELVRHIEEMLVARASFEEMHEHISEKDRPRVTRATVHEISMRLAQRTKAEATNTDAIAEQVRAHVAAGWDSAAVAKKFGVEVEWVDQLVAPTDEEAPIAEAPDAPVPRYAALKQSILDAAWRMIMQGGTGSDDATIARTLGIDVGAVEDLRAYAEEQAREQEQLAAEDAARAALPVEPAGDNGIPGVVESTAEGIGESEAAKEPRRLVKADRKLIADGLAAGKTVPTIAFELNLREDSVERVRREIEASDKVAETAQEVRAAARGEEVVTDGKTTVVLEGPVTSEDRAFAREVITAASPEEARPVESGPQQRVVARSEAATMEVTPQQLAVVFTALGKASANLEERAPDALFILPDALALVADLEDATGLTARQIFDLLRWARMIR